MGEGAGVTGEVDVLFGEEGALGFKFGAGELEGEFGGHLIRP